jgi:hypothetical protein
MIFRSLAATLAAAVTLGACSDTLVPNLNNPGAGEFDNPTRAQIATLMQGLIIGSRVGYGAFIRDMEIVGRDAYNLDGADPRWVSEMLVDLDPGGFGGNHWLSRYTSARTATVLLTAADAAAPSVLTDDERSAVKGFARTMYAHELYKVWESRGSLGLVVEIGANARDIRPLLCEDAGLDAIAAMLDDAYDELVAAGTAEFPTELPSGFAGFDEPATFAEFNRALRAKVAIYQSDFTTALAALDASFLDDAPESDLRLGVFHTYSTAAGDATNPIAEDPATGNLRAHPSVADDAPSEVVGGVTVVDRRFTEKVVATTAKSLGDVSSSLGFVVYEGPGSPIPIITNEELILLRAQAYLGLAQYGNAATDINYIRTRAGGLSAIPAASLDSEQEVEDELLVQKRYSLLFESPSRLVDMRFYGRLDELPLDEPTHNVEAEFPIPTEEVQARGGTATCGAA